MIVTMSSIERRKLVFLLVVVFFFISLHTLRKYDVDVIHKITPKKQVPTAVISDAEVKSWKSIVKLLDDHAPGCQPPQRVGWAAPAPFDGVTDHKRPDVMAIPEKDVELMRKAHEGFVKGAKANPSLLAYKPGSEGVVTTAGGKYLPVLVISIRMLRRTGSKLPVEVFLTSEDEYEKHACEEVLPALNAKCIVLKSFWKYAQPKAQISKFQLKIFAMLLSSFESVVFLDADCFPTVDPTALLHTEPFSSKGLVTWPDFWTSTASPKYFKIAATTPPPTAQRATSEAGELLVSKRTHAATLALAAYYNYYGPDYYYPLLSQGSLGEGDKETFLSAALALDAPFYAVAAPVRAIGNLNKDGVFAGSAMVQYDPREDVRLVAIAGGDPAKALSQDRDTPVRTKPAFVHANVPKFNPGTMFFEHNNPTVGFGGKRTRAWVERCGVDEDLEPGLWEEIRWTACELSDKFESWRETGGNCELVKEYQREVFGVNASKAAKEKAQQ